MPENRVEELIDHWHNAQLMHPGRDKMQQDLGWRFKFSPGYYAILDRYCSDCAAKRILADKPDPGTPGGRLYKVRWKGFAASRDSWEPPSSFCAEVHHGLDGLSEDKEYFFGCQGRVGPFGGCSSTVMDPPWHLCLFLCL